jgi:hypothetical protein
VKYPPIFDGEGVELKPLSSRQVPERPNGEKVAAKVTIHRGADMTKRGKRQIANWLRRQADFLESHGDQMANRFTASWRYSECQKLKVSTCDTDYSIPPEAAT